MIRRLVDRVRDEYASMLRGELDGLRDAMDHSLDAAVGDLRHELEDQRNAFQARELAERDDLAVTLLRLARALEAFTSALDGERSQRLNEAELLECLVREIVVGWAPPAYEPARVVGGSINACLPANDLPQEIDLRDPERIESDAELTVGTPVEVRSRFNDRWNDGFKIAEIVNEAGGRRFKLTRRSDGRALPLLFEATDVRRRLMTSA